MGLSASIVREGIQILFLHSFYIGGAYKATYLVNWILGNLDDVRDLIYSFAKLWRLLDRNVLVVVGIILGLSNISVVRIEID